MGKKIAIALAVVGLVVLGWWLISGYRKPEAAAPIPVTKTVEPPLPTAGSAKPPAKPDDSTMRGAADVQIDDDPKGSEVLEGQVVDADDKPVTGAIVSLSSNPPRTTKSGEDGAFSFDQLVLRPYTLVARGDAGVAGPITARLTTKSDPVILKLKPGSKVIVKVFDSNRKPVEKATVELRGLDEMRAITDKTGVATLTNVVAGGYQVAAWADGKAKAFQWLGVDGATEELEITLPVGARVAGIVVDPDGKPVAGAKVRFSGASDWSQQGNDRYDNATSGSDGKWAFAALPAGSFRFVATPSPDSTLAQGTSALVTLDGKTPTENITVAMQPGAVVKGKVVDQNKQPVASARVRIGATGRGMVVDAPRQAYSNATGEFEIRGLPRKALAAVAMHESGASATVDVDTAKGDAEITLTIDVTGTIAGIVVDGKGNPMENMQVSAGPDFSTATNSGNDMAQWRLRGFPEELTDSSGHFKLAGLAKGSYTVSAAPARNANRSVRFMGGGFNGNQVTAVTGDQNVKIVVPPEGALKGKVVFADGKAPAAFTISVGISMSQSFTSESGEFQIDELPPNKYELTVRGPSFQTRGAEVTVESGKTADAGTITVEAGRTIGGVVMADGNPVAGATVHVGRQVFGNGSTSNAPFGMMGGSTKHDTTDAEGKFRVSGFPEGDITIVAESDIGRSKAMRIPTNLPGQGELVINLEKFGALSGKLVQGGKPAEGVFVSVQSTTSPGSIYGVASGPDGSYRYDKLAPDTYRVSAMLGMPMTGMKFYGKQVVVVSGQEAKVDLVVAPGALSVDVTLVPKSGTLGFANAFAVSGTITATTATELQLKIAALGEGSFQFAPAMRGQPAHITELSAGPYTICAVTYPAEVSGMAGIMGYGERHSDSLLAFCKPYVVAASPAQQATSLPVEISPYVPDGGGAGSGSGSGK